jgi:hypothetical protein
MCTHAYTCVCVGTQTLFHFTQTFFAYTWFTHTYTQRLRHTHMPTHPIPHTCTRQKELGRRKRVRKIFQTVREMRAECHFPPNCPAVDSPNNKVTMHERCGGASAGGWQAALPIGDYSQLNGGTCDNDKGMCIVPDCKIRPRSMQSLEVPSGMQVCARSSSMCGDTCVLSNWFQAMLCHVS